MAISILLGEVGDAVIIVTVVVLNAVIGVIRPILVSMPIAVTTPFPLPRVT